MLDKERLKKELHRRGLTQQALAEKTGIKTATMSRYVNGQREPKGKALLDMAKVLGCTPEYLCGLEEKHATHRTFEEVRKMIAVHGKEWENRQKTELILLLTELM